MTARLTDPTDQELRKAFGIHVAGWREFPHEPKKCYDPTGLSCYWSDMPDWLEDANAVLPWLEKVPFRVEIGKGVGLQCGVVICGTIPFTKWGEGGWYQGIAPTVPKAIVICLLRSAGVTVEGKKTTT